MHSVHHSPKKAMDYLGELEEFGLVEKKRRGRGLPSILYVKSFLVPETERRPSRIEEPDEDDDDVILNSN